MSTTTTTRGTRTERAHACDACGRKHDRGNSADRQRRTWALLARHGNGLAAPCSWCGTTVADGSVEHDRVIPAGRYSLSNVIPSCGPCNRTRSDTPAEDFIKVCKDPREARRALSLRTPTGACG